MTSAGLSSSTAAPRLSSGKATRARHTHQILYSPAVQKSQYDYRRGRSSDQQDRDARPPTLRQVRCSARQTGCGRRALSLVLSASASRPRSAGVASPCGNSSDRVRIAPARTCGPRSRCAHHFCCRCILSCRMAQCQSCACTAANHAINSLIDTTVPPADGVV